MRRQNVLGFTAAAVFAILIGGGIAAAQTQTAAPVPDANAGLTRQVNLSPQEQVAQGESILGRMEAARASTSHMLSTARAQRDVVKTLCLNDKLNQLDVALRSARERKQALEAAAQRADADLANHEFTVLSVLRQRTDQLSAEANQCIGSDTGFIGEAAVTSTIDPTIPNEDPWMAPPGFVTVDPPTCGSCYK